MVPPARAGGERVGPRRRRDAGARWNPRIWRVGTALALRQRASRGMGCGASGRFLSDVTGSRALGLVALRRRVPTAFAVGVGPSQYTGSHDGRRPQHSAAAAGRRAFGSTTWSGWAGWSRSSGGAGAVFGAWGSAEPAGVRAGPASGAGVPTWVPAGLPVARAAAGISARVSTGVSAGIPASRISAGISAVSAAVAAAAAGAEPGAGGGPAGGRGGDEARSVVLG